MCCISFSLPRLTCFGCKSATLNSTRGCGVSFVYVSLCVSLACMSSMPKVERSLKYWETLPKLADLLGLCVLLSSLASARGLETFSCMLLAAKVVPSPPTAGDALPSCRLTAVAVVVGARGQDAARDVDEDDKEGGMTARGVDEDHEKR
jgi:hypothetical protein